MRGQKYTFIVEGGLGTDQEGIIHPFYLTSDNEGGYGTKSDYEARVSRTSLHYKAEYKYLHSVYTSNDM